jgi:hypothetical protein
MISLLVGGLPVLLLPDGFTEIIITQSAHKGLAYGMQFAKNGIPHLEDIDRGSDDMP